MSSVAAVLWLLHLVVVVHHGSYQADAGALLVRYLQLGAPETASPPHANMSNRPVVGTAWMAGPFVVVAVACHMDALERLGHDGLPAAVVH